MRMTILLFDMHYNSECCKLERFNVSSKSKYVRTESDDVLIYASPLPTPLFQNDKFIWLV